MSAAVSRVLFIGLDGGSAAMLEPCFERGLLPNLAALWRRSAHGPLRSSDPMVTPVAWTSFSTGCEPPHHGIHEFYSVDPIDRSIHLNDATRVRVPTLWEILSGSDREVVSMNLPMTYPAPEVNGIVVSGSDAPGMAAAFAQCPDFADELRIRVPDYTNALVWKRRPRKLDELQVLADLNRKVFRAQADAALVADARVDWSALMVHFHNLDSLQHRLWPYLNVDDTGVANPGWNHEVESCLRALDDSVGILLELASKRDAAVVALSDHGFGPCRALVNVNGLLRVNGFQKGLAYGTRFRYRAHRLADRFKRWIARRAAGGPTRRRPKSILGQVGCDWKRSVAFAPFGQLSGCIFLTPDAAKNQNNAERIKRDLIESFRSARDPETGAHLFRDAFDVAERYDLDPSAEGMADVLALSADGYQAQAKWGQGIENDLLRPDFGLPATHYREGVIAIDAPEIVPGFSINADLQDVAPTAFALIDEPLPETMRGRVIHEAFENPLPVRRQRSTAYRTRSFASVGVGTEDNDGYMIDQA